MSKEILMVVEMISNEKSLDQEIIFEAISDALAFATKKKYGQDRDFEVIINPKNGEHDTYRRWLVVPDDIADSDINSDINIDINNLENKLTFDEQIHIKLKDALKKDKDIKLDDYIKDQVESVAFGRIAAQAAKQVIVQKVRDAERRNFADQMKPMLGSIINGQIKRVTKDNIIVELSGFGTGCDAIMPKSETLPRENFRVNDRVRAYLKEIKEEDNQVSVILSRSCNEIIKAFFKLEVPEIAEEVIQIKAIAREPGQRTKIAVYSNDKRIDPRGSCIGIRGSRVQAISNEFSGERMDVLIWSEDPVELVIDAMQPAEVLSIVMDEDTHSMDVIVDESQLSLAIGRGGQNVRLASKISGWELNILSQKAAQDRDQGEHLATVSLFMSLLEIDEGLAQALVDAGFTTLEEVAYVSDEELLSIEGVDESSVAKLQESANSALLNQALSGEEINSPQADLLSMEGITLELANKLAAMEIYSMEDLAEQAVDDLSDIKELTPEQAGELIMRARAPWFEGDED